MLKWQAFISCSCNCGLAGAVLLILPELCLAWWHGTSFPQVCSICASSFENLKNSQATFFSGNSRSTREKVQSCRYAWNYCLPHIHQHPKVVAQPNPKSKVRKCSPCLLWEELKNHMAKGLDTESTWEPKYNLQQIQKRRGGEEIEESWWLVTRLRAGIGRSYVHQVTFMQKHHRGITASPEEVIRYLLPSHCILHDLPNPAAWCPAICKSWHY